MINLVRILTNFFLNQVIELSTINLSKLGIAFLIFSLFVLVIILLQHINKFWVALKKRSTLELLSLKEVDVI